MAAQKSAIFVVLQGESLNGATAYCSSMFFVSFWIQLPCQFQLSGLPSPRESDAEANPSVTCLPARSDR
jgi:hypothetical protein